MKKGQLLEQPFVFIFAIVVIGLIFLFGFYIVRNLVSLGDNVDLRVLVNNLESKVKECKNLDFGSVCDLSKITFSSIRVVCFIDPDSEFSISRIPSGFIKSNVNRTLSSKRYNVYFEPLPDKRLNQNYVFISDIRPNTNPLCQNVIGSRLRLFLENKGDYVEVRQ